MKPKAYSYIRFSRPEQLRGDSLRRQIQAAEEWAANAGVEIDTSMRDLGVSAYRGKNRTEGALAGFLSLVKQGRIAVGSYLILESLDRMSREAVIEVLPRFLDIINAGVVIVTLIDKQVYSREGLKANWTPLIMSLAVMARAHDESASKASRLSSLWEAKRSSAKDRIVTARVPAWLRVVTEKGVRRIVPIPERVEIVQRIFREIIAGYGARTIVASLNRQGVPPFGKADGWMTSYLFKIVRSRTVLGEFQNWTRGEDGKRRPVGEPIVDYFPQVVDETTFIRADVALRRRRTAPGRKGLNVANLLMGLTHCAECGKRMGHMNKGAPPKGGRYLFCTANRRGLDCKNDRLWRCDRVEEAVIARLSRQDMAAILSPPKIENESPKAEDFEALIADAERRRARWGDLYEQGDDEAARRVSAISSEIVDLKKRQKDSRKAQAEVAAEPNLSSTIALVRDLADALKSAEGQDLTDVRLRLAETIRRVFPEIRLSRQAVVASNRRTFRHPSQNNGIYVPPPFKDGKPMSEWRVTVTIIDEGPREAPDEIPESDHENEVA